ncbi:SOS response-associated peptidase [Limnobacter humi]|uniref:Abasic site processing protein n=1 Tax=Limnobacter humi TaxID=1778671 RepID=A0ABT1WDU5_9BURK|nr:SOS response-associated peptidase [Limnobacter humi]MCQ8895691.1 SOS response-associated peptidase [Limnobacter humi]
MCGRYVLEGPISRLTEYFDARYTEDENLFKNNYNIAPTTQVPVVRINRKGERVILNHVWGLIPHWAKDKTGSAKLNNARGESVHEKPSFRTAFKKFRCLIPASGYYEWQTPPEGSDRRRQPFYIHPAHTPYFAMAGVCDHWLDKVTGELVMSTAIVTTDPCQKLKEVHDRMPVMIPQAEWADWLDPRNQDVKVLRRLIMSSNDVGFHAVGFGVSAVGKSRLDQEELIKPQAAE